MLADGNFISRCRGLLFFVISSVVGANNAASLFRCCRNHAMRPPAVYREKRWEEEALEATAPGLRERLGGDQAIVDSHVVVGNVSAYLCRR